MDELKIIIGTAGIVIIGIIVVTVPWMIILVMLAYLLMKDHVAQDNMNKQSKCNKEEE